MFSTAVTTAITATSDFANVYLETHSPSIGVVLVFIIIVGGILAAVQLDRSEEDSAGFLFVLGALTAIVGIALVAGLQYTNTKISNKIAEHMVSNVESKYGAKLEIDMSKDKLQKETTNDLQKPKQYTLVFKNGTSAGYKMYFTDKSEPVIVQDEGTPTAEELNKEHSK